MPKGMSEEARIIEWFESALLVSATIVLGIVQRIIQRRRDALHPPKRKPGRPRKVAVDNPPDVG